MLRAGGIGYASAGGAGLGGRPGARARDRFGSRPLAELVAPAVALARKGHTPRAAAGAGAALERGRSWRTIRPRGPCGGGQEVAGATQGDGGAAAGPGPHPGDARRARGRKGFYEGWVATGTIGGAMRAHGGLISGRGSRWIRGQDAGAAALLVPRLHRGDRCRRRRWAASRFAEIMLTLERLAGARGARPGRRLSLHLFVEAAQRALRRSAPSSSADPDFVAPGENRAAARAAALRRAYLETRRPPVDRARATPAGDMAVAVWAPPRGSRRRPRTSPSWTRHGNAVACTYHPVGERSARGS